MATRLPRRVPRLLSGVACLLAISAAFAVPATAVTGGAALWASRYRAGDLDIPTALGVDPGGARVYVTGTSIGPGSGFDYATVAQDAGTGARLWVRRYNAPGNGDDFANALAVSPDGGRVFVTGESEHNFATLAYDAATGAKLWARRYAGPVDDASARAIGVSPDGTMVFVTGQAFREGSTSSFVPVYFTIAYDAATGAKMWAQHYRGQGRSNDGASALAVSPDGAQVYVTGLSNGGAATHWDIATVAYDAVTGSQRWVRRYDGPGHGSDTGASVGVSPDSALVFVTGSSDGSNGVPGFATLAYRADTGATVWTRRFGSGSDGSRPVALAVAPDGTSVYVTGYRTEAGSTSLEVATVAYDAVSGVKLWVRTYLGPNDTADAADALALSPDGSRIYITGSARTGSNSYDYLTLSYDAAGARRWVQRYDGPGGSDDDVAWAVGASPDGSRVYVTGESRGTGGDLDYATLAYDAG